MSIDDCAGVEVTFAAILAAHECGDFEAIKAAASASDIELLQRCANDEACRIEVQTGFWQVKCVALNQHGTR